MIPPRLELLFLPKIIGSRNSQNSTNDAGRIFPKDSGCALTTPFQSVSCLRNTLGMAHMKDMVLVGTDSHVLGDFDS